MLFLKTDVSDRAARLFVVTEASLRVSGSVMWFERTVDLRKNEEEDSHGFNCRCHTGVRSSMGREFPRGW